MLRKRKTIAAVIALVLSVMTLASCGPKQTGGSVGSVELTVWNTQGTDYVWKDLERDIPGEWLEEKTGVSVQNIYGNDGGQWDSKLTKLAAGNNLPDIIWCQSSQGPSHFGKMKDLNKLWLLDDAMLQEYAPNIWKRTPSYIWDLFRTEDGKITGIPFGINNDDIDTVYYDYTEEEKENLLAIKASTTSRINYNLSIRDDVLKMIYPDALSYDEIEALLAEADGPIGDKLLDVPIKTTEEFIDFMYKIKDLNLTENGKKVYAFGYAGDGNDNWEALVYLGNIMYGTNWHQYTAHWNTKTEEIEIPLMDDIVKQMAKTQNQMILDEVIDPESLAHTGAQFQAKIFQGVYAICSATRAGTFADINAQIEANGGKFKYRPLYIDIPAPEGYDAFKVTNPFASSFCMLTTLSEEEMIQVLKWADLQYTDEYMEIATWGTPEDDLYEVLEDGSRRFKDETWHNYYVEGISADWDVAKSMGLCGQGNKFRISPMSASKWTPDVQAKKIKLTATCTTGLKMPNDHESVTSVVSVPPCYAYSSEFGNIQEVVDYWARREEWEIAIKKAIASKEGEFEQKWADMQAIVNDVVDVEAMEKKMTEVARTYLKDTTEGAAEVAEAAAETEVATEAAAE